MTPQGPAICKNKYVYMHIHCFYLTSHRDTVVRAIVVAHFAVKNARNVSHNTRCARVVLSCKEDMISYTSIDV